MSAQIRINGSAPHFLVADVQAAGDYYEKKLGFTIPEYWGDPPRFAMPQRDGFIVMLNQVDRLEPKPHGKEQIWDAYFWCSGVDALYEELRERGAEFIHGPENRELYGMREIAVRDVDGHMLVFAEDLHGP